MFGRQHLTCICVMQTRWWFDQWQKVSVRLRCRHLRLKPLTLAIITLLITMYARRKQMSGSAFRGRLMDVKEIYLPLPGIRLFTNYMRKTLFDQSFLSNHTKSQAIKVLTTSIETISYKIRGDRLTHIATTCSLPLSMNTQMDLVVISSKLKPYLTKASLLIHELMARLMSVSVESCVILTWLIQMGFESDSPILVASGGD